MTIIWSDTQVWNLHLSAIIFPGPQWTTSIYAGLTSLSTISLVLLVFLPRFLSSLLPFLISSVQPPSFPIFWPQKGYYNCSLHDFPVKIFSNINSQSVRPLTADPSPLLWILYLVSSQVTLNFSYSKQSSKLSSACSPAIGWFLSEGLIFPVPQISL